MEWDSRPGLGSGHGLPLPFGTAHWMEAGHCSDPRTLTGNPGWGSGHLESCLYNGVMVRIQQEARGKPSAVPRGTAPSSANCVLAAASPAVTHLTPQHVCC